MAFKNKSKTKLVPVLLSKPELNPNNMSYIPRNITSYLSNFMLNEAKKAEKDAIENLVIYDGRL